MNKDQEESENDFFCLIIIPVNSSNLVSHGYSLIEMFISLTVTDLRCSFFRFCTKWPTQNPANEISLLIVPKGMLHDFHYKADVSQHLQHLFSSPI